MGGEGGQMHDKEAGWSSTIREIFHSRGPEETVTTGNGWTMDK